jgi:ABC-2 type transport system ATP-binding protein
MDTAAPFVDVKSFSMSFGTKQVIRDVSFSVRPGEVFGFLGANGAGKTTTIRTLLGLLSPTEGTLHIDGRRYNSDMAGLVGYLPEERGLYRNEPVLDTMVYFSVLRGLHPAEATKRALAYLDRVGLADKASERLVNLSGGQQQKVQLGTTIIHEPSLMILDEPTEALDPVNRSLLLEIIQQQRAKGAAVMLVTHRMEEVEQLCDQIAILKDGRVAISGTVDSVKERSASSIIALSFSGTLPSDDKLYNITKSLPHQAELTWTEDHTPDDVLAFLASHKTLHITSFEVKRPTLNDIFLALYAHAAPEQKEITRAK